MSDSQKNESLKEVEHCFNGSVLILFSNQIPENIVINKVSSVSIAEALTSNKVLREAVEIAHSMIQRGKEDAENDPASQCSLEI